MRAKYSRIDFDRNFKDFSVVYYAGIGLSYDCIKELTGFSRGQICKRLKAAKVGVRAYRTGHSAISRYIQRSARPAVEKHVMRLLKG